ncbi:hypothetical protein BOQ62_14040 [Chryseobacterium sp. CH21]|uniref:hypothetical protein n=1 Tax=Chryseobacterium sp. CH21 TaxID=713556 RepID=UPI00100B48A8|nr:hypothetical protein [Chryseobacterium sp. CH21]RXM38993.1 hypothetical protein BOQ62_14040 [Chryseobacterium sp. CH21]
MQKTILCVDDTIKRILSVGLFLSSIWTFSQNANESLADYLKNADTILLTSHEDLRLDMESPGKSRTIYRDLLKNGVPNNEIIINKVILTPDSRQKLIQIIKDQKSIKGWDGSFCFEPHNTLFIYKENQWKNIELCFGCKQYGHSKDVPVNREEFLHSYHDWLNLEAFFREHGVQWEVPKKKRSETD